MDLDAAWQLIQEFEQPASAIIKHTNPCGCAESATLAESYRRAFEADPISAFGGVLAFNRTVDEETAREIAKTFIEAIAAPDYDAGAPQCAGREKESAAAESRAYAGRRTGGEIDQRRISGADAPTRIGLTRAECQVKTRACAQRGRMARAEFGWKVCKHVKSNAIVYARAGPGGQRRAPGR